MSAYHRKSETGRAGKKEELKGIRVSSDVALRLEAIRQRAKDGLLALCVDVGIKTLETMFEQELEKKVGKKGKHDPGRKASRHSRERMCPGIMFQCRSARLTR